VIFVLIFPFPVNIPCSCRWRTPGHLSKKLFNMGLNAAFYRVRRRTEPMIQAVRVVEEHRFMSLENTSDY
jgi:hypothetical protein